MPANNARTLKPFRTNGFQYPKGMELCLPGSTFTLWEVRGWVEELVKIPVEIPTEKPNRKRKTKVVATRAV